MKKITLNNTIFQGLMMAAVVAAATTLPDMAWAQGADLSTSVDSVHRNISNIPNLISGIFYIGGAALIGAGALKLKMHAEQPTQHPLGHGLGRIGAGTALIALPAFGQWLNTTMNFGNNTAHFTSFGAIQ